MKKLFEYSHTKAKNGKIIDYYKPLEELWIDTYDAHTHRLCKAQVLNLSVHKNTDLWKVSYESHQPLLLPSFECKVSGDHSIIAIKNDNTCDSNDGTLVKLSPSEITLMDTSTKALHRLIYYDHATGFITYIHLALVDISKVSDSEVTYDFTLKDHEIFFANGLLVQDTTAVFMPQTEESQQEMSLLLNHVLSPNNSKFKFSLAWDAAYGIYQLTKYDDTGKPLTVQLPLDDPEALTKEILSNISLIEKTTRTIVRGTRVSTTVGRLLFNMLLPDHFTGFINEPVTKKRFSKLLHELCIREFEKTGTTAKTMYSYHAIHVLGNKINTIMPINYNLLMYADIKKKVQNILSKMDKATVFKGIKTISEALSIVKEIIKKQNAELYDLIESGTKGSWSDIQAIFVSNGYISDVEGRVIDVPVRSSLLDGTTSEEYFTLGYGSRKGIVDRAINTAGPGYLIRQLAMALSNIYLGEHNDCGTKNSLNVYIKDDDHASKFIHKYLSDGTLITHQQDAKALVGKTVSFRSPLYCQTHKLCKKCYGTLYKYHGSNNVGIIAAQTVGERIQQDTLKTFHTGGVAKHDKIPQIIEKRDSSILVQDGEHIYLKIKQSSLKIALDDKYCKYKIVGSTVLVYSGTMLLSTGSVVEKLTLDNNLVLLEFYPDQIQRDFGVQNPTQSETKKSSSEMADSSDIDADDHMLLTDHQLTAPIVMSFNKKQDNIAQIKFKVSDISTNFATIKKAFQAQILPVDGGGGGIDGVQLTQQYFDSVSNILSGINCLSTHVEVVLSQLIRSVSDVTLPWRIDQQSLATITSLKSIPFKESPMLALCFEDVGKSVAHALTHKPSNKVKKEASVFEHIMNDTYNKRHKTS